MILQSVLTEPLDDAKFVLIDQHKAKFRIDILAEGSDLASSSHLTLVAPRAIPLTLHLP